MKKRCREIVFKLAILQYANHGRRGAYREGGRIDSRTAIRRPSQRRYSAFASFLKLRNIEHSTSNNERRILNKAITQ